MSRLAERSSTSTASTASLAPQMVQRSVSASRCASPSQDAKLEPATPRASPSALYPYEYSALPLSQPAMSSAPPADRLGFELQAAAQRLHRADVHTAPPSAFDSWDINENDLVPHSLSTDYCVYSRSL